MRLLAIDTATERCSVALRLDGQTTERSSEQPRGHADLVLPMVADVLREAGIQLRDLDGIAYGRGPGAFTGVRIAVGVVQGLAFGAGLPTIGISNLAAVAQQAAALSPPSRDQGSDRILICMDARMNQVYWSTFGREPGNPVVQSTAPERVNAPEQVLGSEAGNYRVLAGTGFKAYPQLLSRFSVSGQAVFPDALPRASEIAFLGEAGLRAGLGKPATEAEPVYVRDEVAHVKNS